jgi:hypothetical protein
LIAAVAVRTDKIRHLPGASERSGETNGGAASEPEPIYLVTDPASPVTAFTSKDAMKAYLKR